MRHVADAERPVTMQRALAEKLERDGHKELAPQARSMLAEFEQTLADHRSHPATEREKLARTGLL